MSEFFKIFESPKIRNHKNTRTCWLCDIDFENEYKPIHHYCKLSGNYLSNANQNCIDNVNKRKIKNLFAASFIIILDMIVISFSKN